jgi:DUF971 family protein
VVIDARIVNTGKEPIRIKRMRSALGSLSFTFADSAGRGVKDYLVLHVIPVKSADKDDFIMLDPGNTYGSRVRLVPTSDNGRTYYSLVTVPGNRQMARFPLDVPGRYSVAITYGNSDDGHRAGVRAWHGGGSHELHSSKCWFEIKR